MGKIRITLPVCPSANVYWRKGRGGRLYVSEAAIAYKQEVAVICHNMGIVPQSGELALKVLWYRARKSGDTDNRLKVMLDALNGFAYHDDKQVADESIKRTDSDPRRARMVVVISEYVWEYDRDFDENIPL